MSEKELEILLNGVGYEDEKRDSIRWENTNGNEEFYFLDGRELSISGSKIC